MVNEAGIEDMGQSRFSRPRFRMDLVKVPEGEHVAQHVDLKDYHGTAQWLSSSKAVVNRPGNKGLVATQVCSNSAMLTKEEQLYQ